jgi:hypothetical protein
MTPKVLPRCFQSGKLSTDVLARDDKSNLKKAARRGFAGVGRHRERPKKFWESLYLAEAMIRSFSEKWQIEISGQWFYLRSSAKICG